MALAAQFEHTAIVQPESSRLDQHLAGASQPRIHGRQFAGGAAGQVDGRGDERQSYDSDLGEWAGDDNGECESDLIMADIRIVIEGTPAKHPSDESADTASIPLDLMRRKIVSLETEMRKEPQVEIPPQHYLAKGLYAREITIPAGTLLTGKIHLEEHLNIISKGDISVLTDDGIKRITAPATIISKPGIKRVGYAHADTVWTTIHACELTDIAEIEEALVVDTFQEFERRVLANAKEIEACPSSEPQ